MKKQSLHTIRAESGLSTNTWRIPAFSTLNDKRPSGMLQKDVAVHVSCGVFTSFLSLLCRYARILFKRRTYSTLLLACKVCFHTAVFRPTGLGLVACYRFCDAISLAFDTVAVYAECINKIFFDAVGTGLGKFQV